MPDTMLRGPPYPPEYLRWRALNAERKRGERLREQIIVRDGMHCGICHGVVLELPEVDHIVPIALGGLSVEENMQVAHSDCNRRKGAKPS